MIRSFAVTFDLGRRLQLAGTVQPGELRRAVADAVLGGRPFPRALADVSAAARAELDRRSAAFPGEVQFEVQLVRKLPPQLCARLLVVPVRLDPRTGVVEAAAADPRDPHAAAELAYHLGAQVRLLPAPLEEVERAAAQVERRRTGELMAAAPQRRSGLVVVEDEEVIVPLVRRTRTSILPPGTAMSSSRATLPPPPAITPSQLPPPPSRSTAPMVVDFSQILRQNRDEAPTTHRGAPPDPNARTFDPRMPPFASLTPVLEALDGATDRDALLATIVRGITTAARSAVLLAPRRGRFMGIAASPDLADAIRGATIAGGPAIEEAVTESERYGPLDTADAEFSDLVGLRGEGTSVLLHVAYVASKPALVLVNLGMGDPAESSRRGRVLATAAGGALSRFLRR